MENNINTLIHNFEEVKEIRKSNQVIFNNIAIKVSALHQVYVTYLKKTTRLEHNFGLDSFYFQKNILEQEQSFLKQTFLLIDNQMYKDYYKLYRLIIKYVKESIIDKDLIQKCITKNTYPIYKDLDNESSYNFDTTVILHDDIISMLQNLTNYTSEKDEEWKSDLGNAFNGFNIDNFVNTAKYANKQIEQQIAMYIDFLQVFIKFHERYLSRLNLKLKLIYGQIQSDIKFEQSDASNTKKNLNESQSLVNAFNNSDLNRQNENMLKNLVEIGDVDTPSVIKKELEFILQAFPSRNNSNNNTTLTIQIPKNNYFENNISNISEDNHILNHQLQTIENEIIQTNNYINMSPRFIPLPTPDNTNYNTPYSSIHNTPLQSIHNTPLQSAHNTPTQSIHNTPIPSIHNTPLQSVHNTPRQSIHNTPITSIHNTPLQSIHNTPRQSIHNTPKQSIHNTPRQSIHNTPIASIHNSPIQSLRNTPLPSLYTSPIPSQPSSPKSSSNDIYQKEIYNDIVYQTNENNSEVILDESIINDEIIIDSISEYEKTLINDNDTFDKSENEKNITPEEYQQIVNELKDIINEVPHQIEYGKIQIDPDYGPVMPL